MVQFEAILDQSSCRFQMMQQIPCSSQRTYPLMYSLLHSIDILEVCGSTRTHRYTRTRPVPAGMRRVRVDVLRVGSGTGTKFTSTGIPVFTRKEHHFSRCWSYIEQAQIRDLYTATHTHTYTRKHKERTVVTDSLNYSDRRKIFFKKHKSTSPQSRLSLLVTVTDGCSVVVCYCILDFNRS